MTVLKESSNRKYVPKRSSSSASKSKPPLQNPEILNVINGGYSLGREASQSLSTSKHRPGSPPPPMPIEAVVEAVSPNQDNSNIVIKSTNNQEITKGMPSKISTSNMP